MIHQKCSGECDVVASINSEVSQEYALEDEKFEDVNEESKRRLASLFLRMQTILHVSKSATQEIVDELNEIGSLVGVCTKRSSEKVLRENNLNIEGPTLAQ